MTDETTRLLMKMPLYKVLIKDNKKLAKENSKLIEKVRSLEYAIQYLESRVELLSKVSRKKINEPSNIIDLTHDDGPLTLDELQVHNEVKLEPCIKDEKEEDDKVEIVVEEVEVDAEEEVEVDAEEEVEVDAEEEVEVDAEEEIEVDAEEEVEVDADEEVEVDAEEEEVEQEETEEVEQEETEEVEQEETEEVEQEEEEGEEDAEEDVYEIQINGKTYYVMNETDSIIYEADENGEITIEAGVYKNGKPTF